MSESRFPVIPVLFGSLGSALLVGMVFLSLNYYRAAGFDASLLAPCAGLDAARGSDCATRVVHAFLADRQWLAVQFSLLVPLATVVGMVVGLRVSRAPRRAGLLVGAVSGLALLMLLEPGRLAALAAAAGAALGGLLAAFRLERRS